MWVEVKEKNDNTNMKKKNSRIQRQPGTIALKEISFLLSTIALPPSPQYFYFLEFCWRLARRRKKKKERIFQHSILPPSFFPFPPS